MEAVLGLVKLPRVAVNVLRLRKVWRAWVAKAKDRRAWIEACMAGLFFIACNYTVITL